MIAILTLARDLTPAGRSVDFPPDLYEISMVLQTLHTYILIRTLLSLLTWTWDLTQIGRTFQDLYCRMNATNRLGTHVLLSPFLPYARDHNEAGTKIALPAAFFTLDILLMTKLLEL